jgi:hypothetical protein
VELLIEEIQGIRDSLRENAGKVAGLIPLVRQVARENKGLERDLTKARSSFATLQRSVKALREIEV